VPPELKPELRAVDVSKPGSRRVPVAAAIGAAVLLLGAGAALVVRNSGEARVEAKGAPETAPAAVGTASPGAPGSAGTAPGSTAVAKAAPGDNTEPDAIAALVPETGPSAAAGGTAVPGATPEAPQAAPTAEAGAAREGTVRVAEAPASQRRTRGKPSEAMAESPKESRASSGMTARPNDLQRRIDTLDSQLSTRLAAGQIQEAQAKTAYKMLDRYRAQAGRANSAQRQEISKGLDYLENSYLKR